MRFCLWLTQVCTQCLELPERVHIVTSAVAAGHLSSSSIYPACFAPYLISTACSDGRVRFWRCDVGSSEATGDVKFDWSEWDMMIKNDDNTSAIRLPGSCDASAIRLPGSCDASAIKLQVRSSG